MEEEIGRWVGWELGDEEKKKEKNGGSALLGKMGGEKLKKIRKEKNGEWRGKRGKIGAGRGKEKRNGGRNK